jgi:predicted nucleotidyltransferase
MDDIKSIREREELLRKKQISDNEQLRISELEKSKKILNRFKQRYPEIKIFLFGSITQPNQFRGFSDIDIAIENFNGSRLDIYPELEEVFDRKIDLVILEKCSFRDEILKNGIII